MRVGRVLGTMRLSRGFGAIMRYPGLLLTAFLLILVLPLAIDRAIERSSLIRVTATTEIVSFALRPVRPGAAVQIQLLDVEDCAAGDCSARDGLLQIGTPSTIQLQAIGSGQYGLRINQSTDAEGESECRNRWVPVETEAQAAFDAFEDPDETKVVCNPDNLTFALDPEGGTDVRWLALRVQDLVIGQALGPSSHPDTSGLHEGHVTLLSPSFRSDVIAWVHGGSGELRDFRQTAEQTLSAGDAARLGTAAGPDEAYLTLALRADGTMTATAVALSNELEIITYGLPGQIIQSSWFDRLAADDLLGMWITLLIIVASLWLEALFLSGRPAPRVDADADADADDR